MTTRAALGLVCAWGLTTGACGGGGGGGGPTPPGAPTIGLATPGDQQVSVTFSAPAGDGGSPITSYTATCAGFTAQGAGSPLTVLGLTNGVTYVCTVTATNIAGTGAPSADSNAVVPAAVPDAPIIGTAFAGDAQVTIEFTAPPNDGGSPIQSYTATCGGQTATGPASPLTVLGLTNGNLVTCTVTATNTAATSPPSAASNAVRPAANADSWATLTAMPTARWSVGLGEVGGVIYAAGGYNGSHLTQVEAYDVAGDGWTGRNGKPGFQTSPATSVVGGLVYEFGGTDNFTWISTATAYNPATDGWTPRAAMTAGVRSQPASAILGGLVHVVGGHNGSGALSAHEAYDPSADTWAARTSMPTARTSLGVAVLDGILYAVGGSQGGVDLATVEAYDPSTGLWSARAAMPTARSDLVVVAIDGLLYAVGGGSGVPATALAVVEVYNPATNAWITRAPMSHARIDAQGVVYGGRLYVVGGYDSLSAPLNWLEVYTP